MPERRYYSDKEPCIFWFQKSDCFNNYNSAICIYTGMQAEERIKADISPEKTANLNPDKPPGVPKIKLGFKFFEASYASNQKTTGFSITLPAQIVGLCGNWLMYMSTLRLVGNLFPEPFDRICRFERLHAEHAGKRLSKSWRSDEILVHCFVRRDSPYSGARELYRNLYELAHHDRHASPFPSVHSRSRHTCTQI